MTHGAIIFAQNSDKLDYIKLAVFAAKQVKKYLEIPVSIITDSPGWLTNAYPNHPFDQVVEVGFIETTQYKKFHDGALFAQRIQWKNLIRDQVYDLTPYDRTLVIDSDYIINSTVLKPAFDNHYDFQIYHNSMDLAEWRSNKEFTRINQWSVPFYWGTTFIFEKNLVTKAFFDLITYIKANWFYFRMLYRIEDTTFRNDFAFSVAVHIMNGKTNGGFAVELPGKMTYITDKDMLISIDGNKMKFLIEKKNYAGQYTLAKTTGIDVHVMNKMSLSRYIDGGLGV